MAKLKTFQGPYANLEEALVNMINKPTKINYPEFWKRLKCERNRKSLCLTENDPQEWRLYRSYDKMKGFIRKHNISCGEYMKLTKIVADYLGI